MNEIIKLNILQFSLVYVLLLIVLFIMKKYKVKQSKLLIIASVRMSLQLTIAGFILTYILKNPKPIFTVLYIVIMICFSIYRVLSNNKSMNKKFKLIVSLSLALSGILILLFFIIVIVGANIFNPQYTIPIGGMVIGNAMTGVSLGLKTFNENISANKNQINVLVNLGVPPKDILSEFAGNALETALLPTLNTMLGMGIITLPGMMTGQILSGTLPTTAIMYQIAITISICTVTCVAVFCSLFFGYRTLYNKKNQMTY